MQLGHASGGIEEEDRAMDAVCKVGKRRRDRRVEGRVRSCAKKSHGQHCPHVTWPWLGLASALIGTSACTARGTEVAELEGLSDSDVNKQAEETLAAAAAAAARNHIYPTGIVNTTTTLFSFLDCTFLLCRF